MKLEITRNQYFILVEFFVKHNLNIKIISATMDEALCKMGFAEEVPCVVEPDITPQQIEQIVEICREYEIDAINNKAPVPEWYDPMVHSDYEFKRSEQEKQYERYGWIESLFLYESANC